MNAGVRTATSSTRDVLQMSEFKRRELNAFVFFKEQYIQRFSGCEQGRGGVALYQLYIMDIEFVSIRFKGAFFRSLASAFRARSRAIFTRSLASVLRERGTEWFFPPRIT